MKKTILLGIVCISLLGLTACNNNSNESTATSISTQTSNSKSSSSSEVASSDGDFVKSASEASFDGKELKGNSYSIKITDHKVIQPGEQGNEYGEKPIIAFWYDTMVSPDYDNSTTIDPSTSWIMNFKAIQDNDANKVNELQIATLSDETASANSYAEIKPGGTVPSAIAYTLTDEVTPVTLTAENVLGDNFGKAEFQIK